MEKRQPVLTPLLPVAHSRPAKTLPPCQYYQIHRLFPDEKFKHFFCTRVIGVIYPVSNDAGLISITKWPLLVILMPVACRILPMPHYFIRYETRPGWLAGKMDGFFFWHSDTHNVHSSHSARGQVVRLAPLYLLTRKDKVKDSGNKTSCAEIKIPERSFLYLSRAIKH